MEIDSMKKIYCILLILAISLIEANAQSLSTNSTQVHSPNAASLGRYSDIPVSHHTGVPQIGIPLYTIQEGPISLPISLSYHASGMKVMDLASWVGAGWSLNAGGAISRVVRGAPDEGWNTQSLQYSGHYKDYGFSSYVTNLRESPEGYGGSEMLWNDVHNGLIDAEPDLFTYNFNGYSGKFYFRDDRTPVFLPQNDFKVEVEFNESQGRFISFCVITTDGTRYYFGEGNAHEISNPRLYTSTNYLTSYTPSSWFLTRIVSADGKHSISLTYEEEKYSYLTISIGLRVQGSRTSMDGLRLKNIQFSDGLVNFEIGNLRQDLDGYVGTSQAWLATKPNDDEINGARYLERISISNNNGFCKAFDFQYSYFEDNS
ncbi:MAG: hypothetical protein AAFU64_02170, partial [Bacteroidota bacterium]